MAAVNNFSRKTVGKRFQVIARDTGAEGAIVEHRGCAHNIDNGKEYPMFATLAGMRFLYDPNIMKYDLHPLDA